MCIRDRVSTYTEGFKLHYTVKNEFVFGIVAALGQFHCCLLYTSLWNGGGKAWTYEYKYRRGGKTLCALYAREKKIGFMVIFGKAEQAAFEAERGQYSQRVQAIYDGAKTYRDGKWVMFEPADLSMVDDFVRLLAIKRRPNRK